MYQTLITRLLIVVVILDVCAMLGCHRSYYRRAADAEVKRLVLEKSADPRWNASTGSIAIDPYSRMFNPFSIDHPPIPPDDASSHQFMHRVDGKSGYPHWHANGDTDYVENPDWKSYLPVNENGQLVLNLDRAYQLALLHSSELQQQNETLYLSALDVSLERFGFDSQLFSGFNSFLTTQGRFRNASGRSTTQLSAQAGANGAGTRLTRLGTTGANFAVGIANTILFNFAGTDNRSATTLIDFSVIQPLMRGAGRDRIMESLTQAERTLLANVRQLDRFRRGFYLNIATGRSAGTGPNRAGAFLTQPNGAVIGVGGFYGLLLQQQQIRNQEFNVRQLESVLEQFREFFARDRLDAVQLKQFESAVYGAQSALVEARIRYQTAVDRFKIQIGLPPDLDVVIEDEFLNQFNLISDEINDRLIAIAKLREQSGEPLSRVGDLIPGRKDQLEGSGFKWTPELSKRIAAMAPFLDSAQKMLALIKSDDVAEVEADLKKLDSVREDRVAYLKKLAASIQSDGVISAVDPELYSPDSIESSEVLRRLLEDPTVKQNIRSRLESVGSGLQQTQRLMAQIESQQANLSQLELYETITEQIQNQIPILLSDLNNAMLDLSLLQARARSNSIQMADVEIDDEMAIEIARCMRRDWMNARASLVDNWRRIEFVADQLESQVDLVFQGDIGNVGDNPLKLRYETGQLRAGFRFDSPIVRRSERNQYRQALIQYNQSRRQFYQFEDEVKRNLRDIVRNINRDKILFELNRRSVLVQIDLIESTRLQLEAPPQFGAQSNQLGGFTARNLTDAFNNLNNFQNRFLGTWTEYEVLRRGLDFDMGTMQLDEVGGWQDPGKIDNTIGARAAAMMGITLDCQFCSDAVINPVVIQPLIDETIRAGETIEAPIPPRRFESDAFDRQSETSPSPELNLDSDSSRYSFPNIIDRVESESAPALPDEATRLREQPLVPSTRIEKPVPAETLKLEIDAPPRPTNDGTDIRKPTIQGLTAKSGEPSNSTVLQPSNPKARPQVASDYLFTLPAVAQPTITQVTLELDHDLGSSVMRIRAEQPDSGAFYDSFGKTGNLKSVPRSPFEIDSSIIKPLPQHSILKQE